VSCSEECRNDGDGPPRSTSSRLLDSPRCSSASHPRGTRRANPPENGQIEKKIARLKFSAELRRTEPMSKSLASLKSVTLAVVLSLPLVACASFDGVSSVASAGGSGGSPLAGSPSFSTDSAVASNRAAVREVTASHDASPRTELRVNEVLTCRQCK
jgi:hypothetical protein